MGRSHFKSPDLLAKLKLISMLLIAARFGKVHFVQVCNSDPWAAKAKHAAKRACKVCDNDPWLTEHTIKWSSLAAALPSFGSINHGQASEQLWELGAKLDVYNITDEQRGAIAAQVKPDFHQLGTELIPQIKAAAALRMDDYAQVTNKLYADFMQFINIKIGQISGWKLPTNKNLQGTQSSSRRCNSTSQ